MDYPRKTWACVIRIGGIGDNLIASSVLPLLKQRYDCIEVISKEPNHVVFENNPFVDKLTVWPESEGPTDALTWTRGLAERAREYDAFFDLSHSCEATLAFLEGQFQFHWPQKMRRKWCDVSYLEMVHDIADVPHLYAPRFFPTDAEQAKAEETRRVIVGERVNRVVGWCLSGSRIDKIYPYIAFAISRLITELNCNVVMFGAPNKRDFELAKAVQNQVKLHRSDVGLHLALSPDPDTASWPIRRILSQVQACDVMISPDTGPAWAVASEAMPKIVLLSHASPHNIVYGWRNTTALHADQERVPCWPCHRLHETFDTCRQALDLDAAACMADISVDSIITAAGQALLGS